MNSIDIDGTRIAYQQDGPQDAPAIVLLNSLGTNLHMWKPQKAALAREFRVVRLDCRGHGGSALGDEQVTIERLGRDVLGLLDHLGIERAHVCGLSLGGVIALWLAVHHPARIDRAVFANTAARIGTVEVWNARIDAVRSGGMAAVRDAVLARFFTEGFRAQHPDAVGRIAAMLDATDPAGYAAACEALRDTDLRGEVGSITTPSLVIGSGLDPSTPLAQAEELHAAIPGSELAVLPDAAHMSSYEQPSAFNDILLGFLRR